jgi:hypothetical protein
LFFILSATVLALFWSSIDDGPLVSSIRPGITFSTVYTDRLGLDAQEVFSRLVEDIGVRAVRLPVYWSDVEGQKGTFDWDRYDRLITYAQANDVALTIVLGVKQPRWPECYVPDWAEGLNAVYMNKHADTFVKAVVERYRSFSNVERWQIENEPFFPFGICQTQIQMEDLDTRIELVRSLDDRPIQLTVSGEIGPWQDMAKRADVLGISMYRQTYNEFFGHFIYPLSPEVYQIRAGLVSRDVDKVIVSELQAEPWFPVPFDTLDHEQQYQLFSQEQLIENVNFARRSGMDEVYLWGAEWWAYLSANGDNRLWETARTIFLET